VAENVVIKTSSRPAFPTFAFHVSRLEKTVVTTRLPYSQYMCPWIRNDYN